MPGGPALAASASPFTQDDLRKALASGQFFGGGLPAATQPQGGNPGAQGSTASIGGGGYGQQLLGPSPSPFPGFNPLVAMGTSRFMNPLFGGQLPLGMGSQPRLVPPMPTPPPPGAGSPPLRLTPFADPPKARRGLANSDDWAEQSQLVRQRMGLFG